MSENPNSSETEPDAEFPAEEESQPRIEVETGSPFAAWRKKALKWLIILLVLAALSAAGYWQFLEWRASDEAVAVDTTQTDIRALREQIDYQQTLLDALEQRFENIQHPDFSDDIAAVRRDVQNQLDLYRSLPPRMSTLENSVASLAGISEGARETFLLAEAEYYMQIANAQLQLANNPTLATLALRMADERVTQLADPGLTGVRQALSDELAALEVMQKPDLEGATLTLSSLAKVVESLPLAGGEDEGTETDDAADEERGAMDRAWTSVKDSMSGLVKVTPPDQARLALISPAAEYFLRNNIALQLQAARLALLRGEHAVFSQSLDDAATLLNTWFDTDSDSVSGALQKLSEVKQGVFVAAAPDISGSLRQLRAYRTVSETVE